MPAVEVMRPTAGVACYPNDAAPMRAAVLLLMMNAASYTESGEQCNECESESVDFNRPPLRFRVVTTTPGAER
jgi:hypothetical protein